MALDLSAWPGLEQVAPLPGGHRNEVWEVHHRGERLIARRSRRSPASLGWELDLIERLNGLGFLAPVVVPTDDGRPFAGDTVVQRWIPGREPSSADDWRLVADELQRLHAAGRGLAQRPECCSVGELAGSRRSVDADLDALPSAVARELESVFSEFAEDDVSLIHGDPHSPNLRITDDGRVGLLDWDESRVDVTLHDLSNLGVQVLGDTEHQRALRLSDAWEAANGWVREPDYAQRRLDALRQRR